jgi:hypothetical protein
MARCRLDRPRTSASTRSSSTPSPPGTGGCVRRVARGPCGREGQAYEPASHRHPGHRGDHGRDRAAPADPADVHARTSQRRTRSPSRIPRTAPASTRTSASATPRPAGPASRSPPDSSTPPRAPGPPAGGSFGRDASVRRCSVSVAHLHGLRRRPTERIRRLEVRAEVAVLRTGNVGREGVAATGAGRSGREQVRPLFAVA